MWNLFTIFKRPSFTVEPPEARIYQMSPRQLSTAPTAQGAVRRMRGLQTCEVLPMRWNSDK